jgi:hypothetical protein
MLMKLTPPVNFINLLRMIFLYERHFGSLHVTRENEIHMKNACIKC